MLLILPSQQIFLGPSELHVYTALRLPGFTCPLCSPPQFFAGLPGRKVALLQVQSDSN